MQIVEQEFIVKAIESSTASVFSTMLDSGVEPGIPGHEGADIQEGFVSLVGLTGPWSGTGSFRCSAQAASRLSSRMLMTEPVSEDAAITDEIMDAVAELTNMIVGNIKNLLEERIGPMAISIPTVVYGRNFQFKSLTGTQGITVPFSWESDSLEVRLCVAPSAPKSHFPRARPESAMSHRHDGTIFENVHRSC